MNILGLDPDTNKIGWALYDSDADQLLDFGIIALDKEESKLPWTQRVEKLSTKLRCNIIYLKRKYRIAMAFVEMPTRGHNTIIMLAYAAGHYANSCDYHEIPCDVIEPYKIKTWLRIRLNARREVVKALILNYVNTGFGLEITKEEQDKADAVVIALAGIHYWKEREREHV